MDSSDATSPDPSLEQSPQTLLLSWQLAMSIDFSPFMKTGAGGGWGAGGAPENCCCTKSDRHFVTQFLHCAEGLVHIFLGESGWPDKATP